MAERQWHMEGLYILIHKWQDILSGFTYNSNTLLSNAQIYWEAKAPLPPGFVSPG